MKKREFVSLFVVLFIATVLFLPAMSLYAGGSKVLKQKLAECEDGRATLESENADLKTQLDNRTAAVQDLEQQKRQCEADKRELEQKIAEYEELISYWQGEIEAYGFESEDPTVISRTVTETLAQKNARIVELEQDREMLERELEQVNMQLEIAKRKLDQAEQDAEQYRIQYTLCERKVRDLEMENAALMQDLQVYEAITSETKVLMDIALDRIQYALRNEIRRGEVRVFKGTLGITIDVLAADMFDTGSVELTPTGKVILAKIAGLLNELDGYLIGIIGNADRRPIITPALKNKYPTNWELSSHRGASVVRFFLNEANIDPRMMVAMGLGEYQPIDNRRTAEAYGNNRRIDIVLLPIDAIAAVVIGAEVK